VTKSWPWSATPSLHEGHAVRACYAVLRMQERVKKYAEESASDVTWPSSRSQLGKLR